MASADDAELLIAESVFLDDGADDMYDPYERERDQGVRSSAHALSTAQSISSAARTSTASISSLGNRGKLDAGPGSKELSESFLLATVDVSQDAGLITTDVRPLTATAVGGTNTTGFGARASQHLRFQPTSVMPGPEHERSSHSSGSALGLESLAVTSSSNKSGISAHSGTSAALHNATATAGGDEDLDEFEKLERQLMRISGSTGAQPAPDGGASSDFAETSGLRSSISSIASSVATSNRAAPGNGSAPDGRGTSSSSLQAGWRQAKTAPPSAASQLPRHPVAAGVAASRSSNNAQPRFDNSNSADGTDGAFIRKEAPHLQAAQPSAQRPPSHFNGNHFSAQQHPVQQHQQPHAQTEAPALEGLSDTERQLANLVQAKVSALQQQIDRYNAEVARLKDTENSLLADRKKIEEDAKQLNKERAEFKGWREAEHSRFESWRNDVTRKLEQERRVAVRQARAAAAAATALPDRQARTELEETQKANSKLKADLQAAEARYKATVERHRNEKKALQDRVDELERQVQRYEDERIAVVFGSQASASTAAAAVAASAPQASNGFVPPMPPSSQLTSFTGARKGSFSSASGLGSGTAAGHDGAGPRSSLGGSAAAATGGQARGHSRGRSIEAGKRAAGAHTAGRINASGGGRGRPGSISASTRGINSRLPQHHDAPSSSALDDAEAPAPAAVSYNPAHPSGAASSGGNDLTLENVPGASSSSPSAKHAEVGANGQVFRDSVTHDSETPTGYLQTILGRSTNAVNQSSAAAEMSLAGALAQADSMDGYNPARYGSSASASSVAPQGGPALPKAPASQPSIYAPTIPQRLATSGPRAHEVPTAQHMLGGGVAAGNGTAGRTATAGAVGASTSSPLKAPASSLQAQQLHQQAAQAVTVSPSSKQQQPSSLAAAQAQSQPAPVVMSSLLRLHLQHHRYTPEQLRLGVLDDFDPRTGQPIDVLSQRNLDDKGKVEYKFADGSRLVRFKNGTEKEQRGDGTAIVRFGNGDVKRSVPRLPEHGGGGVIDIYYYAGANTIQATYPPTSISASPRNSDLALSYDIFEFPSGQIELHWGSATGSTGDGSAHSIPGIPQPGDKEILFADGTIKTVDGATGEARSTLPDGRTVVETPQ